jgi:hypothetical protein
MQQTVHARLKSWTGFNLPPSAKPARRQSRAIHSFDRAPSRWPRARRALASQRQHNQFSSAATTLKRARPSTSNSFRSPASSNPPTSRTPTRSAHAAPARSLSKPRIRIGRRSSHDLIDNPELSALLLTLCREIALAETSVIVVEGAVAEWLTGLCAVPAESAMPAWLQRVREMIHATSTDNLRLAWLAPEAGLHPMHVARTFRRFFRRSIGEYAIGLPARARRAAPRRRARGCRTDCAKGGSLRPQSHEPRLRRAHRRVAVGMAPPVRRLNPNLWKTLLEHRPDPVLEPDRLARPRARAACRSTTS